MLREPRKLLEPRESVRREERKLPEPRESENQTLKLLNNKMFKPLDPLKLPHKNQLLNLQRRELPPRKLERKLLVAKEDLQRNQANEWRAL